MEKKKKSAGITTSLTQASVFGEASYMPPDSFQQLENIVPLVEDVGSNNNTELWLVQLPSNELGAKDLMEQQWNMQVADDADCKLGHFYSSRGEMYDVVKQEMDSTKLFAIFPNAATQLSVHRITQQICFRKNIPRPPETPAAAGSTKKPKAGKPSSLEDSNKRPLASERQTSTLISEASVGKEAEDRTASRKKSRKERSTTAV
ncbi:hypothetical protein CY35_10G022500 [Sphagnum magellanicum]|nr:hypothetical protein CY35_10G022500 [Sphagnum magellanicum]KAH9549484.1 hypothetical protein CY35_10G022500 [Sphagnum magellanicum]KAH9549485.1 hypothetical protein CY35_10G022500 [Sphagnum magellanicum]